MSGTGTFSRASDPGALSGWSVVVTRPVRQAEALTSALERRGAGAFSVPTISIVDPDDGGAGLRKAARRLSEFDWVVFTSENAVARLIDSVGDARRFDRVRVAAIGEGTSEMLARLGVVAEFVPSRYVAEALVDQFPPADTGGRVLLPRAAVARDVVPEGLRRLGWSVEVVEAYKTIPARISAASLAALREADAITFTSSSTVLGFLEVAETSDLPAVVASIGPITTRTAQEAGIDVTVEADVHTSVGLVEALAVFARTNGRPDRGSLRPS
jgi:uroporphyrinogen-III synthase